MVQREVVNEESKEIRVPYTLLDSVDISKVAFAINVQLTLNDANEHHSNQNSLPFVFPNDFDNVKDRDNLFIYGPSGCGKSCSLCGISASLFARSREPEDECEREKQLHWTDAIYLLKYYST